MTATILFDFDGVLVDSIEIFSEAVNVAGRKLEQPVSFVPDDLRAIRRMSIPEIVHKANVDPDLSMEFIIEIDRELYRRRNEIHMFPEMDDLVRQVYDLGEIGIVSASSVAVIDGVMKNHRLRECFQTIVGGDMPGTKAEKIRTIMSRNGSTESQTCMIGDTVSDIEQSRDAGVISIAVSWGWHSIEWLRTAGPNYEAHHPEELVSLIKKHILPNWHMPLSQSGWKSNQIEMKNRKTLLAQANHYINPSSGGIVPPIDPSVTFARDDDLELIGDYVYGRYSNPTYEQLENIVCELEGAKKALFFASGLAAIAAVFETVKMGEHIAAPKVMYHGTVDWLKRISERRNIELTLFDPSDPDNLASSLIRGKTSIVWIESPINPSWDVIDIERTARDAHAAGAILAVDCTAAAPISTQSLELGADIVFHSATKYLNGHSDLNAGVLATREVDARWDEIDEVRRLTGGILGSFEAWLLLRGMRTLAIRWERCSKNAMKIAEFLQSHPAVERVLYPGLPSHPSYPIAKRQMTNGFGGMMSVQMKGGREAARQFVSATKLFVRATSLGGVESLIEHRRTVEGPHSKVPVNLIRISVGIEDVEDLIEDLRQSLLHL